MGDGALSYQTARAPRSARLSWAERWGVHADCMSAQSAGVESSSTRDAPTPDLGGVSAFAAKVLDQLSLSAWLPGAFFAVSATVLAQFARRGDIDLARVVTDVADQWVTVLVWTVPMLLISVLVIQASSFAAIQFLGGVRRRAWTGSVDEIRADSLADAQFEPVGEANSLYPTARV